MATAKKLPSGNWRVNLYTGKDLKGRRQYKSFTADTKKEAEFMAAEYNLKRKTKPADLTLGEAMERYISSKENVLSPTTINSYRIIKKYHFPALVNLKLSALDQVTIQQAINSLSADKTPKTVHNAHGLLSATLNMFVPEFRLTTKLPRKQKAFKELPAPEVIINLVKGTEIELPVLLALWCGYRMSEIQGFYKSDFKNNILTVNRVTVTVNGEQITKSSAKTYNSNRQNRVPKRIAELIRAVEGDRLVTLSGTAIYKRFVKLLEANGYKMTFHDLRHLNASVMLQLGIPDKYAMERGGWSTTSTLKSVYQHTFSEERKKVDDTIDNYFESFYEK